MLQCFHNPLKLINKCFEICITNGTKKQVMTVLSYENLSFVCLLVHSSQLSECFLIDCFPLTVRLLYIHVLCYEKPVSRGLFGGTFGVRLEFFPSRNKDWAASLERWSQVMAGVFCLFFFSLFNIICLAKKQHVVILRPISLLKNGFIGQYYIKILAMLCRQIGLADSF